MMSEEDNLKNQLEEKFPYLKECVTIKPGRLFAALPLEKFSEVFSYSFNLLKLDALSAITGFDTGEQFFVLYHLNREGHLILTLKVELNRLDPQIDSVTPYFPSADIYERELMDLLGIGVKGLATGSRYPLPDNWPKDQHPLRKDWVMENTVSPGQEEEKNA